MNKPKAFLEYYPNRIAQQHDFSRINKSAEELERFSDKYLGPIQGPYNLRSARHFTTSQEQIGKAVFRDYWHWKDWVTSGRNVFEFSEGLLEMLSNTDATEIEFSQFNCPFPICYLDLSAANLFYKNDEPIAIEGVYVMDYDEEAYNEKRERVSQRRITFYFTGNHTGEFEYERTLSYIDHGDYVTEYSLDPTLANPEGVYPRTIKEAALNESKHFFEEAIRDDIDEEDKVHIRSVQSSLMECTLNLVVNCLLYLALPSKEVQQQELRPDVPQVLQKRLEKANTKAKRKAVEADIRGLGFTRVNLVGASIRPRAERAASTDTVAPHWRRGHWRNQRLGAGLQEQRLTWIKPVVVNKQLGQPAKGHIYNVQGGPATTTSPSPAAT